MEAEPREDISESSEDEADSFDNYGVFQSDYEFKFVQEGNDKTTLMLPPVTYDSMEVKYFNIEIEVDSELNVSALEKEETGNGTTRFFFRIAKQTIPMVQAEDEEEEVVSEKLVKDGYEIKEVIDYAAEKAERAKKRKPKKPRTAMEVHNYSKPKVVMTSAPTIKVEDDAGKSEEIEQVLGEALDGTQIDKDAGGSVELCDDGEEEFDDEGEDMDDDGDDDMDDFDETEIGENMTLPGEEGEVDEEEDLMITPKRKGKKVKDGETSEKKRRKYDKTNFYSKNSSNFTVETNDEGTSKIFKCVRCDYTSKWPGNMRDHVRIHTGERPFQCEICEKTFANQSGMQKHMVIHSDDRPHACDICGFAFKLKRQLVKHQRRHLTPGSVLCPICGKHYYSNSELQHHMPTHTGERKFMCNICHKTFTSISSLGRHKTLHTGARFECHICGHMSMRKEYWRTHMIKAHQYDENDELLAKRARFSRLFDQTEQIKIPSVHTIRVVKSESVKPDPEGGSMENESEEQYVEMEPGEVMVNDENVQYIISLDY